MIHFSSVLYCIHIFIFGHFGQLEYSRAAKERKQCELDEHVVRPQCTGKRDTIYIYDTSDLMLIKIKYGRYNNRCVRTHESDTAITIVPVEIAVIAVEHAIIYSFVKKVCERGERVRMTLSPRSHTFLTK